MNFVSSEYIYTQFMPGSTLSTYTSPIVFMKNDECYSIEREPIMSQMMKTLCCCSQRELWSVLAWY